MKTKPFSFKNFLRVFLFITCFSLLLMSEECEEQGSIVKSKIYPNPARERINIQLDIKEEMILDISIYDANGNQVMQPVVQEKVYPGEFNRSIDINMLSSGAYVATVNNGKEIETLKFLITK